MNLPSVPQVSSGQSNVEIINTADVYDDGFLRVEHNYFYIACGGKTLSLGRAEFLITSVLARHPERFISSRDIWFYIWKDVKPFNQDSLKVMICSLRRQFEPFGVFIESKTKIGYRLTRRHSERSEVAD